MPTGRRQRRALRAANLRLPRTPEERAPCHKAEPSNLSSPTRGAARQAYCLNYPQPIRHRPWKRSIGLTLAESVCTLIGFRSPAQGPSLPHGPTSEHIRGSGDAVNHQPSAAKHLKPSFYKKRPTMFLFQQVIQGKPVAAPVCRHETSQITSLDDPDFAAPITQITHLASATGSNWPIVKNQGISRDSANA